ncbi:ferric reductase-like transmembrane domain-containing protein [Thermoflexus sp.]|uniref:ferric reductase-like transmembrane domain-containing protein n=1 Tax=Thermoflexus sp. TaxID=1969742 RepID=UPI0035E4080E
MGPQELDELSAEAALHALIGLLLSALAGAFLAILVLPRWLPALVGSLQGPQPKAYWYLSRASGLVAYVLLWLSMILGLIITSRIARLWPGGPTAFDLHQHTALLSLALSFFHALILLGDRYISFAPLQVFLPFASANYRPFSVGLGQLGFYLLTLVGLTFYVRRRIGYAMWRRIHYLSFGVFVLVTVHGVLSGTDGSKVGVRIIYQVAGASVLALLIYRILATRVRQFLRRWLSALGVERP